MRVAVVSGDGRQVGKTSLCLLLVNAYPNATGKESVYVTNKSLNEVLQYEQFPQTEVAVERSINVVTALASTETLRDEDIVDYAYRPTSTSAMLFDIYSNTVGEEEAFNNFINVVNKLGRRFVLFDINGSVYNEDVKRYLDACDLIIYVFRPIKGECIAARKYLESLNEDERQKVKLLCNMWDPNGVKRSTIQDFMKYRTNSMLWFPYHENIQRTMFEGRLCILNKLIIEGRDSCLSLRQPIKDILSFMCDTKSIKVVRDISKWQL